MIARLKRWLTGRADKLKRWVTGLVDRTLASRWVRSRLDYMFQPGRRIPIVVAHLGHAGQGIVVVFLAHSVLRLAPWVAALCLVGFILYKEIVEDVFILGGHSQRAWKDHAWDAYQMCAGFVALIVHHLGTAPGVAYLVLWFAVYFVFVKRMEA